MQYAKHFNPNKTPQAEQDDPRQIKNSAGGYSFQVDNWTRMRRFLILGSEGGSFYASERKLTVDNAKAVQACLDEDGARAVSMIVEVSDGGKAPKNDPAIFALALAAAHSKQETRSAAYAALPKVCRIGTHLFQFAEAVNQFRGWGRGLRKAIGRWYTERTPEQLCHQIAKYQQRNGWSHRDLLRLSHATGTEKAAILRYVTSGADGMGERLVKGHKSRRERAYGAAGELPAYLAAFEELKAADERRTIALIREYGFTHEMIATEHKNSADVWEALLERMPMTAMVRNLGKMTEVGLLKPMSATARVVAERLANGEAIRKARLHPISLLSALRVYKQGHGDKGALKWSPVASIVNALDSAFYLGFDAIEPSGKRTLLALDVSGSMGYTPIPGMAGGLTPRDASAVLAMVTARVESQWHVLGFSHKLVDIPITPKQRLDDVVGAISGLAFGATDCALPFLWAAGNNIDVDVCHVYTDSESYVGSVHPHQALRAYRAKSGINAKLACVAMVANEFSLCDPSDPGQCDFVGFSTDTPVALAEFGRM